MPAHTTKTHVGQGARQALAAVRGQGNKEPSCSQTPRPGARHKSDLTCICSVSHEAVQRLQHCWWKSWIPVLGLRGCRLQRHHAVKSPSFTSDCIPVRTTFNRDKGISSRSFTHLLLPEPSVALSDLFLRAYLKPLGRACCAQKYQYWWDSFSGKLREESLHTKQLLRISQTSHTSSSQKRLLSSCPVHTTQFSALFPFTPWLFFCKAEQTAAWQHLAFHTG